jgi:pyruvate/2-oxoglutarate dehydrogenase complex dihydrolipoamide acyltransferase (E2) component
MKTTLKLPRLGENVTSVFVVDIVAAAGQSINEGDVIITVETDKATLEVTSPIAGTVVEILVSPDQEITFAQPYVVLETNS